MAGFMLKQCPFSCNVCDVKEHGNKYCADRDHEQVYQPCDARATAGASALLHTTAMAPLTPPLTLPSPLTSSASCGASTSAATTRRP